MRRMRNRILLSGVAALLGAAVITGPAAASTSYRSDDCERTCGKYEKYYDKKDDKRDKHGRGHGSDCIELLGIKICLKLGVTT